MVQQLLKCIAQQLEPVQLDVIGFLKGKRYVGWAMIKIGVSCKPEDTLQELCNSCTICLITTIILNSFYAIGKLHDNLNSHYSSMIYYHASVKAFHRDLIAMIQYSVI